MNHWKTASATDIIGGIVSTDALDRRSPFLETGIMRTTWNINAQQEVRRILRDCAAQRGINPSYLAETILIKWLDAAKIAGPIVQKGFPRGSKFAYHVGQLAAIEQEFYGSVSINLYLFDTVDRLSDLRKQLKQDNRYIDEVKNLYDELGNYYAYRFTADYYPWFFIGFYRLPTDFLCSGILSRKNILDLDRQRKLPPTHGGWRGEGATCSLQLKTDHPTDKERKSTTLFTLCVSSEVQNAIRAAATQQTYTITGLVETVLIDWLNRNYLADHTEERNAVPTESRQSYFAGQLARIELDQFGEVSLDAYLQDAGASLGALKPRLRKAKQLTRATETLFREVRLTDFVIKPAHRFWFFAGFSQLSFDFLAAKHSRGEVPRN